MMTKPNPADFADELDYFAALDAFYAATLFGEFVQVS